MEPATLFQMVRTKEDKTQFINSAITITVAHFYYCNGKHIITDPRSASAEFGCCGKNYTVENSNSIDSVEDWFMEELLPKVQMLGLLLTHSAN